MIDLRLGDCLEVLPTIPSGSVDAVISDPIYPEIDRPYGRISEAEWHELMRGVVAECRRILKPLGSAVFILQANQERVGRTRPWLWEFMAWAAREWNQVQDFWWWNPSAPPTIHCRRERGLARPSVKACVWLGPEDCYRNQDEVLWEESQANAAVERSERALRYCKSGVHFRQGRASAVATERGGVTPFNLIPIANTNSTDSSATFGHGAGTPEALCDWWIRYITRPGDVVLDPFAGLCTVGLAAIRRGRAFIGIEKDAESVEQSRIRLDGPPTPLFDTIEEPVPCTASLF